MRTPLQNRFFVILMLIALAIPSAYPRRSHCTAITCLQPSAGTLIDYPALNLVSNQDSLRLKRIQPAIDFPADADWINTQQPVSMSDLKGKLVLLDFWTYCCINCMHTLPVLKQAEREFPDDLVVVGVHTAKFATEQDTENIREAVLRYEIEHPVLNDFQQTLWTAYGINTWPTLLLIDPEGYVIWSYTGEITYKELDKVLKRAVGMYSNGRLSGKKIDWKLESANRKLTPLSFPGKVLADAKSDRLFIADTNHNRIVVTHLDGSLLDIIGSGRSGSKDGGYADATFFHPQGMALGPSDQLYVCDTENHLIRRIDLQEKQVITIAGTGQQLKHAFPGFENASKLPAKIVRKPKVTPIASPWDACIVGNDLFIAMAGPHQIWRMSLDEKSIAPFAGNGVEDIVDGRMLPSAPYAKDSSSFAQPSGIVSNGSYLFVADSEGSSIRAVPTDVKKNVDTIIGTSMLPNRRLFTFGDVDGVKGKALLQHPLGVALYKNNLLVADTYNNKIKRIDLKSLEISTLFGSPKSGDSDDPPLLDEPGGISAADDKLFVADTNNHRIRVWDFRSSKLTTLEIAGLAIPGKDANRAAMLAQPSIPKDAIRIPSPPIVVREEKATLQLDVELTLPEGWKLNADAPLGYFVMMTQGGQKTPTAQAIKQRIKPPQTKFKIPITLAEKTDFLQVAVTYYYCQEDGSGVCLADTVVFDIPLKGNGDEVPIAPLRHTISIRQ